MEPCTGQTGSRYPLGTPGGSRPLAPRSDGVLPRHAAWWRDPRLQVGRLTAAPRLLRLCNALTGQNCVIEVSGTGGTRAPRYEPAPRWDPAVPSDVLGTSAPSPPLLTVPQVCGEEPVGAALRRARGWQEQLEKYTACYGGVPLNPQLSLEQNGIPDSTSELRSLRLDPKDFIPTVFLYFNDDAGSAREGGTFKHPQNPKIGPSPPQNGPPPLSPPTRNAQDSPKNSPGPRPSQNP